MQFFSPSVEYAPSTMISISLRAPSPSRAICSARFARTALNALRNAGKQGSEKLLILPAPRRAAMPVAKASKVSEVEVSPSTDTALKLSTTPAPKQVLQNAGSDGSVRKNESKHGAHIGRNHAGAFGDAADANRRSAEPNDCGSAF